MTLFIFRSGWSFFHQPERQSFFTPKKNQLSFLFPEGKPGIQCLRTRGVELGILKEFLHTFSMEKYVSTRHHFPLTALFADNFTYADIQNAFKINCRKIQVELWSSNGRENCKRSNFGRDFQPVTS